MNARELLELCRARGIFLFASDGDLSVDYPEGGLDDALFADLRANKTELLGMLAEASQPPPATGKRPGPESWGLSNGLSIIGTEPWDLQGEDRDLAKLARTNDDDWRVKISRV